MEVVFSEEILTEHKSIYAYHNLSKSLSNYVNEHAFYTQKLT